jgi:hypothetical protein
MKFACNMPAVTRRPHPASFTRVAMNAQNAFGTVRGTTAWQTPIRGFVQGASVEPT